MLSDEMRRSLAHILVECLKEEAPDLNRYPSQLLCLAELMTFTRRTEDAIGNGQLHALKGQLEETLKTFTSYDLSGQPLQRRKVSALVLDLMHLVEVVQFLIDENVTALSDWAWNKQLRFYLVDDKCVARMVDAEVRAGQMPKTRSRSTRRCTLSFRRLEPLDMLRRSQALRGPYPEDSVTLGQNGAHAAHFE